MQFLNPAFLGALALLGIPILLHLIRRRNLRVIRWAAWDFLLLSQKRTTKRVRLEQIILLLVRIAILLCAILAFARPVIRTFSAPLLAAGSSVHIVIVLDNSFSMGYVPEREPLFARARGVAEHIVLRAMRNGDAVSVVLQSSQPEVLIRGGSYDRNHVLDTLRQAKVSDLGTDHGKAAVQVAEILAGSKATAKEVYWITDSRWAGLDSSSQAATQAWKAIGTASSLTWIDCGARDAPNASVEPPRLSRELVTPQAPVRIEAKVHNTFGKARPGALAHLEVGGKRVGTARVDLPASGEATATFVHLFERPGVQTGSVHLEYRDGLAADNVSRFAVRVVEALHVLVLNPRPGKGADEAFYLSTALSPDAGPGRPAPVKAVIRRSPSLSGLNLESFDCLVLSGGSGFQPLDVRALREYIRRGGGMLVFPGTPADAAALSGNLADLLPVKLGRERRADPGSPFRLDQRGISHPALLPLKDPEAVDLGAAAFDSVYTMPPVAEGEGGRVLLRFGDGTTALAERRYGLGRVVLAAFSAGVSRGDLALRPAYLPLLHQMVAYLAAGNSLSRSVRTGEPILARFEVAEGAEPVRVLGPDGLEAALTAEVGAEGALVRLPSARRAGVYRFAAAGGREEAFVANPPENESNLAHASQDSIREKTGQAAIRFASDRDDIGRLAQQARRGSEMWRTLIAAAVILLFVEAFLAQRFGRKTLG